MQKIVFSGVQPSGNLHIGNYMGAIRNWLTLQEENKCIFCVVDLHSLTVPQNPEILRQKIREIAIIYMASGIDPEKSILFQQSKVSEHSELAWLLNCITPVGMLNRMTQFKDKSKKYGNANVCMGLYDYPVLMASDILLYNTDLVPVGDDQKQHVELTRDVAGIFNSRFGVDFFKLPDISLASCGTRIMSLQDATKKMSKSDDNSLSAIYLTDDDDAIVKKIKKAKTDSLANLTYDKENRPEMHNLLNIFSIASGESVESIVARFDGKGNSVFKIALTEALVSHLAPVRQKIKDLSNDLGYVDSVLENNSLKAREIAAKTLAEVQHIMGLN